MHDLNWNDVKVFLAVSEAGQIGKAAVSLKVDPTTLSRRLRRLERHLEATLFEKTREGQTLTEAGESLLAKAETMAAAARAIDETPSPQAGLSGQLRISVSEGFGSQFLTPYLAKFSAKHPNLTIDLVASSGFLSPSKREADIAVMLSRPTAGPVLCRKLADYRLQLYASRKYMMVNGEPEKTADLRTIHDLVGYVPDLLYAPELNYLDEFEPGLTPRIRSSSINAQARLLCNDAGIGVLPCFIGDAAPELVAICSGRSIVRSLWLITHQDTQNLAKVRAGKEWLVNCVSTGHPQLMPAEYE